MPTYDVEITESVHHIDLPVADEAPPPEFRSLEVTLDATDQADAQRQALEQWDEKYDKPPMGHRVKITPHPSP